MAQQYTLARDPLFYLTVVFFALLTTGFPAVIGQPLFMPLSQTIVLFIFLIIPLRQRLRGQTLLVMGLWYITQALTILGLTLFFAKYVQYAFNDGFNYSMNYAEWFYSVPNVLRPDSFAAQPVGRIVELLGVLLGSLVSGGLIGIWFLVRALNLTMFSLGGLLLMMENGSAFIAAVPLWAILRTLGYGGAVILLAEPLLTSNWHLAYYWRNRRRLLLFTTALLLAGLLLEFILPDYWRTLFR